MARTQRKPTPAPTPQHPAFDPVAALDQLLGSTEVAEMVGRKPITVRALATRHNIGTLKAGRRYFTLEDVERIRAIDPRGGRAPDSGREIEYRAPLETLRKGRPKKDDPHRAPAAAADAPPAAPPSQIRTAEQVAELLGVSLARVSRNALNYRIGHMEGKRRMFREDDVARLRDLFQK